MSKYLIVVSLDHTSYIHVQHGCRFEEFELKEKKWRRETSCGHLIEFVGYAYNFLAVAVFSWFYCVPFLSSCWNNYFWISRGLWVFQFLMRHVYPFNCSAYTIMDNPFFLFCNFAFPIYSIDNIFVIMNNPCAPCGFYCDSGTIAFLLVLYTLEFTFNVS